MQDHPTLAMTIPEAIVASRVSRSALYRALQRGDLVAKKAGRRTLILREELDRYLAALPTFEVAA